MRNNLQVLVALAGFASATDFVSSNLEIGSSTVQIPGADWNRAMQKPNATGHFEFSGFSVWDTYPGSSVSGWSVDVNVAADISAANATGSLNKSNYIVGTTIQLNPPSDAIIVDKNGSRVLNGTKSAYSTWKVRALLISGLNQSTYDNGKDDDGSCSSLLGSSCLSALRTAMANRLSLNNGFPDVNPVPEKCKSQLSTFGAYGFELSLGNLTQLPLVATASDASHALGNDTDYNQFGSRVYPLILNWAANDTDKEAFEPNRLTFVCARPNKALNGGTVPSPSVSTPTTSPTTTSTGSPVPTTSRPSAANSVQWSQWMLTAGILISMASIL